MGARAGNGLTLAVIRRIRQKFGNVDGIMSDDPPARPLAVTLLWVACGISICIGLASLALGSCMALSPVIFADPGEEESILIIGGLLILVGLALVMFHVVPIFLKPNPANWKLISGFLIASAVTYGLFFWPLIILPLPVVTMWNRDDVKEYFGIRRRGRDMLKDDDWDEAWDRPRGR